MLCINYCDNILYGTCTGIYSIYVPIDFSSSPAYAAAKASLLRQYRGSFRTVTIPCYVASGKCGNPGELPYRYTCTFNTVDETT